MKKTILFLCLLISFQNCSEITNLEEEEEQEKELKEQELEDTSGLPFKVKWSINRTEQQIQHAFKSFLHVSDHGLYYYNPVGENGFLRLNKENGASLWNLKDETSVPPYALKKIGNYLWVLALDINDPTILKINPENGSVLFSKKSGVYPSIASNNSWFGLRKKSTALYNMELETGNDIAVCDEFRVDNIRNFLVKEDKLVLMDVRRGSRSLLSINPNTCGIFWEIQEGDEANYGHLNYFSFAVDLGSKILSTGASYFIIRSPNTGEAEFKFPLDAANNLKITHMLHDKNKSVLFFHDTITGKVFAFNWFTKTIIWESKIQSREVGQLFLVSNRLFLYSKNNNLYELNTENGTTISEKEIKVLLPFEIATVSYAVNRLEDGYGEEYFRIFGDEIYYTTEKSTVVSARLE
ncbi:PQQ-binding-like beta-propeller repeat protein [uncultured Maribacter sp.]|uniref:PQQ-binding-like beta-propeller repeat protein n=1 Tax=uncultured Maribacter sp. TaxID=431308 RepID=UPI002615C8B3|nr:PQQ-binding-like beta-propeller repeat protein [uncultured Maribacter sp.]